VYDFLPDAQLGAVSNRASFPGMLVFDKWTCNCDSRQSVFHQPSSARSSAVKTASDAGGSSAGAGGRSRYLATMVDQGFCFNASEWSFPDAPLRGLYSRHVVYGDVAGLESFQPFLGRLENLDEEFLEGAAASVPPEWYEGSTGELGRLVSELAKRRAMVAAMLSECRNAAPECFPQWRSNG
jgi:hypothetical protein